MRRPPIFLLLLFVVFVSPASAGPVVTIDAGQQFRYAEKLYADKDYTYAIGEYKRFLHFFPTDQRAETAMYKIGLALFAGNRFQEGISAFQTMIDRFETTPLAVQAYFRISEGHVALGNYGQALITLRNLTQTTHDSAVLDEAYYRIGWIHLETASWDKARSAFYRINPNNQTTYQIKRLSAALNKETDIPRKHPELAGLLSIVPGAGHLYCERYQDALVAFIINGGLAAAAYTAFDDGNNALGGLIGLVELGIYSGTMYSAVSSAHKHNKTQTRRFVDQLKQRTRLSLSADPRTQALSLSLRYVF